MKIGVGFPYHSIGSDPEVYRSYAKRAEELGFAHMTFVDHVLGPVHAHREPPLEGPYTEESVFHEPLTLMSWLAGQTKRLVLFSAILILPQRQAVLVAKQAAEIQLLSQGRLRLGPGDGVELCRVREPGCSVCAEGSTPRGANRSDAQALDRKGARLHGGVPQDRSLPVSSPVQMARCLSGSAVTAGRR